MPDRITTTTRYTVDFGDGVPRHVERVEEFDRRPIEIAQIIANEIARSAEKDEPDDLVESPSSAVLDFFDEGSIRTSTERHETGDQWVEAWRDHKERGRKSFAEQLAFLGEAREAREDVDDDVKHLSDAFDALAAVMEKQLEVNAKLTMALMDIERRVKDTFDWASKTGQAVERIEVQHANLEKRARDEAAAVEGLERQAAVMKDRLLERDRRDNERGLVLAGHTTALDTILGLLENIEGVMRRLDVDRTFYRDNPQAIPPITRPMPMQNAVGPESTPRGSGHTTMGSLYPPRGKSVWPYGGGNATDQSARVDESGAKQTE